MLFYHIERPHQVLPLERILEADRSSFSGHWFPASLPFYAPSTMESFGRLSYRDRCFRILDDICDETVERDLLEDWTDKVFDREIPLVYPEDNLVFAEMFHGPTGSAEDLVARWVRLVLDWSLRRRPAPRKPLFTFCAAGGSGIALAAAMGDHPFVKTLLFYPKNRLTRIQEAAFAAPAVVPLEVDGTYEDCMHLQRCLVHHEPLKRMASFYSSDASAVGLVPYALMILDLSLRFSPFRLAPPPVFILPEGRFHLSVAMFLARLLGGNIQHYIVGTIADTIPRYLAQNQWQPQPYHQAVLGSILDVTDPPFWPLLEKGAFRGNIRLLRSVLSAYQLTDEAIRTQTNFFYHHHNYFLAPDGALAAAAFAAHHPKDRQAVVLLPTHPSYYRVFFEKLFYNAPPLRQGADKPLRKIRLPSAVPEALEILEDLVAKL